MFNAGQRPAVNVGLSVSRVGRAAQFRAMRDVSGSLRLDVAQYKDMAVFAQFGADIDSATASLLRRGERLMKLLIQPAAQNYKLSEQVILLLAASNGMFEQFERNEVNDVASRLLQYLKQQASTIIRSIDTTGRLTDNDKFDLTKLFSKFVDAEKPAINN
jgi:F-type H+-transporting ATPase subunit alpha